MYTPKANVVGLRAGTPVVVLSLGRTRIRLRLSLILLLGHNACLPMLIKQPKILAYIICCPGDRSGGQSITLYTRLIWRDKACTCTCMLGLIQLTTLFLFSGHFQSTVELLKGVDKHIIKLVTLVSVVYSSKS